MRLLVVGAGSTGGYFGGRLAQAGRDVTFLVRPGRAAQLREHGLQVRSPHGDFGLVPQTVTAAALDRPYDAVLLSVKAYSLEAALDDMGAAVGPDTMIMPVLNGMRHMEVLADRFGAERVIGGVCKIAATLDAEGRVVQLAKFQELSYGEMNGAPSPRTQALDALMGGAGFDAKLSPTVAREMWEKWTLLATMGAICCLMRGTIGEIVAAPGGEAYVLATLDEAVAVVRAVGEAPSEGFLATIKASLTAKGSNQSSSMYRDLQGGGRVEAEQIVGDLVRRGREHGIATPLLAAAYAHLCVYQHRLAGQIASA